MVFFPQQILTTSISALKENTLYHVKDQLIISAWNCCPESYRCHACPVGLQPDPGAAGLQAGNTVQAALVFLLLSWCLLCGCCFDCHIGLWSLRKPDSIWPCFEDTAYWQAAVPVYWSCLQCVCSLWTVVKPGLLFPHQLCADWSAGAAVAKMLQFHLSGPGLSHGPFETSKNVVSGRGRACNHLVYCKRRDSLFTLIQSSVLSSMPKAACHLSEN